MAFPCQGLQTASGVEYQNVHLLDDIKIFLRPGQPQNLAGEVLRYQLVARRPGFDGR